MQNEQNKTNLQQSVDILSILPDPDEVVTGAMFMQSSTNETIMNKQAEPISSALTKKADFCVFNLQEILTKCGIQVDTISQFDREALPRSKLYEKLPVVSPVQIFKLLHDVRVEYEVYLHVIGNQIIQQRIMYPELCEAHENQMFKDRGCYPILKSWHVSNPTAKLTNNLQYFLTPAQASFWQFTAHEESYFGKQPFDVNNSQLVKQLLQQQHFDPKKYTNLIRNAHPLQNLITYIFKYPETLLLVGQKVPSFAQRIGLYYGYLMQFQQQFIGSTLDCQIKSVRFDKDQSVEILPVQSLLLTPFSRIIIAGVMKSLIVHSDDYSLWPNIYFYQPSQKIVKDTFLYDFLFAASSLDQQIHWAKSVLHDFVQQFYQEKQNDLFLMMSQNHVASAKLLQPIVKILNQTIIMKLDQLPDSMKTTLTVAKFTIQNLIINICEKLFNVSNDSQLTRALGQKFPEIAKLIDYKEHELTLKRCKEFSDRLYFQFLRFYIYGIVIRNSLNNPVSYQLIQPNQANMPDMDVFFSNLTLIGDLLWDCSGNFNDQNPFQFQFNEQFENYQTDYFKALSEKIPNCKENFMFQLHQLRVYFENNVKSQFQQIEAQKIVYPLDNTTIRKLIQTTEYKISPYNLTSGFWPSTCAYFYFLATVFKQNIPFLVKNLEVLDRNCVDVLQQVISDEQKSSDSMFAVDVSFQLFSDAAKKLQQLDKIFTQEKIDEFKQMVYYQQGILLNVTFIPYFQNIFQQSKKFDSNQAHSETIDFLYAAQRQALQEQETFINLVKEADQKYLVNQDQQNIQSDLANANVSDEIKQFYNHCDQIIGLFDLMRKINDFKQKICKLESLNEEQYFQQISLFQTELNQLQTETDQTILNIQHHTDDIQQRKEEMTILEQLMKLLLNKIQYLNRKEEYEPMEEYVVDEIAALQQYNLFEQIEKEFKFIRDSQVVEELIFNHQQQIRKLNNYLTKNYDFIPTSTLEKLFNKPMPPRLIRSAILVQMFDGYSGDQQQEDSDDQRMRDLDEALNSEGILGQKVEEIHEFDADSVMALNSYNGKSQTKQ